MPRNEYINEIVEGEIVTLDGIRAIETVFVRCTLYYSGGDAHLEGCDCDDCKFVFSGWPAYMLFSANMVAGKNYGWSERE